MNSLHVLIILRSGICCVLWSVFDHLKRLILCVLRLINLIIRYVLRHTNLSECVYVGTKRLRISSVWITNNRASIAHYTWNRELSTFKMRGETEIYRFPLKLSIEMVWTSALFSALRIQLNSGQTLCDVYFAFPLARDIWWEKRKEYHSFKKRPFLILTISMANFDQNARQTT